MTYFGRYMVKLGLLTEFLVVLVIQSQKFSIVLGFYVFYPGRMIRGTEFVMIWISVC